VASNFLSHSSGDYTTDLHTDRIDVENGYLNSAVTGSAISIWFSPAASDDKGLYRLDAGLPLRRLTFHVLRWRLATEDKLLSRPVY